MKPKKKLRYGCRLSAKLALFLSLYFVIGFSSVSFAIDKTELLKQKLEQLPDDTAKVNTLNALGEEYCSKENDKALMYLQEAFTIATSLNYTEGIGKSLLWQGRVYYYKDDYQLADKYLDKAKKPLEKAGDPDALSFWYVAKGSNDRITGDFVQAIEMFKQAIALSKQTGNKKRITTGYLAIGGTLLARGDVDKAMNYFREGLALAKETENKVGVANALTAIAGAYKAMDLPDSSLIYSRQALKIRTDLQMDRHIASSEITIGETLIEMGKYDEAERSLKHARTIFKKLDEKTGIIMTNLCIAEAMSKQGKPEAIDLANRTLQMAIDIDNPNLLNEVYLKLSAIYASMRDYRKAYDCQKNYEEIRGRLFTSEKERMLAEVEAEFQSERKDRDIAYLKEKTGIQKSRNIMLIVLVVVFIIVIFLLIVMFRYKSTAFERQQKLLAQEKIIHARENAFNEKENQLLQEQLESKNRELASKALEMLRYNETISSIIERLENLNNEFEGSPEITRPVKDIIRELENHTRHNLWKEFDKIFRNIHSEFYNKLLNICPELTATEIKTAALLKLNLTTKEIAAITFKSEGGIKTTRYRLRKKLGLSGDDKLVPFLIQI